jgi:hypothetical protein
MGWKGGQTDREHLGEFYEKPGWYKNKTRMEKKPGW